MVKSVLYNNIRTFGHVYERICNIRKCLQNIVSHIYISNFSFNCPQKRKRCLLQEMFLMFPLYFVSYFVDENISFRGSLYDFIFFCRTSCMYVSFCCLCQLCEPDFISQQWVDLDVASRHKFHCTSAEEYLQQK